MFTGPKKKIPANLARLTSTALHSVVRHIILISSQLLLLFKATCLEK
jgi:hypothetical protein